MRVKNISLFCDRFQRSGSQFEGGDMRNIILCGLPASGKSTIGKMVAEAMEREFIDTDQLIEAAYTAKTGKQATCRQICHNHGEKYFRQLEDQQIAALKG